MRKIQRLTQRKEEKQTKIQEKKLNDRLIGRNITERKRYRERKRRIGQGEEEKQKNTGKERKVCAQRDKEKRKRCIERIR